VPKRKPGFFVKIIKAKILTPVKLVAFGGLEFEPDTDIGGRDRFCSGAIQSVRKILKNPVARVRQTPCGLSF
jgi:hypothetical protein